MAVLSKGLRAKREVLIAAARARFRGETDDASFAEICGACGTRPSLVMSDEEFIEIRRLSLLTQKDLAKLCGISACTVSLYESGTVMIPGPMVLVMRALKREGLRIFKL